ncbi:hypothetical protein B0A49_10479 [Cryomyces minteri]|uniref:non-specific serine/threonine protein kinase n=1 Tax=Cryomyces minteri TaxID=331657 RepID=A0A4U0WCP5_9PEZI|nr:hypothetical protein B0A49_10479 [Cryomyces minteri]
MDRHGPQARPPTRRKPLADATVRSNIASTPPREQKPGHMQSSSPRTLPHNESFINNRTLNMRSSTKSPENKHVQALVSEEQIDSKRNSAISTTSTNASGTGRRRKTHIGPWQLGKTIGKGGCSRVRAVRNAHTGQYGAAKIISKAMAESVRAQSLIDLIENAKKDQPSKSTEGKAMPLGLEREIVIMKLLDHRNIVRLYDVWENRNELYLIMEYVQGGELFHYIDQRRGLEEDEVYFLFRQLIAALIYCHRIHIHHRDLKPENILLDSKTHEIKLVDFGMAALQPEGQQLSTPCGSPHYAAPEVVSLRPYDGGKADVWSCGVILYVMLTGTTPFNYTEDRDLKQMFKAIARAEYFMPPQLSNEAQDLLRRIFVPDPARRISMEAIWRHPFMHKYNADFNFEGEGSKLENWIGPQPRLEDWTVKRGQDIDAEILGNMRTLWHSVREEVLIQRLLNQEPNQEKYFYAALVKHRDEHLENYIASPGSVGYSASDYHHIKPAAVSRKQHPSLDRAERSKSGFSIMNDEHLRSSNSFHEPPPSVSSYDPFRASRDPIVAMPGNYMNVTVYRGKSSRKGKSVAGNSLRQPSSLRRGQTVLLRTPRTWFAHARRDTLVQIRTFVPAEHGQLMTASLMRRDKSAQNWERQAKSVRHPIFFHLESHVGSLAGELAETRHRLAASAAKYAADSGENVDRINEMIEQLGAEFGRVLQSSGEYSRRSTSAPGQRPVGVPFLPAITEEGRSSDADELHFGRGGSRAVTDPTPRRPGLPSRRHTEHTTIRVVDPSSPSSVAPLNIRKRSDDSQTPQTVGKSNLLHNDTVRRKAGSKFLGFKGSYDALSQKFSNDSAGGADAAQESGTDKEAVRTIIKKKSSWFRRKVSNESKEKEPARPPIPTAWQDLDDRMASTRTLPTPPKTQRVGDPPLSSDSSEFPMRNRTPVGNTEKRGFARWFRKRAGGKQHIQKLELGAPTVFANGSMTSIDTALFSVSGGPDGSNTANRESTDERSWFARFLHIKPASKILCLQVGRGKARTEIVKLLRQWRQYGIRDLTFDRERNVISGRVDKVNHLQIKPVAFAAQLYVVLEHGRRAQLCLARFTQTKGAASSFRKVIDTLESVLGQRGLLVEDEAQWRDMCEVLT